MTQGRIRTRLWCLVSRSPDDWKQRYAPAQLQRWRSVCDPLADDAAVYVKRARPSRMLDELETLARGGNDACARFVARTAQVPTWVEWPLVERGRRVALAFSAVRGLGLLAALMEGYALSKAARVLVATGRLNQDVSRRLHETGQMNHNMNVRDGLRPGGVGHRHILEVRLLHAMVRRHVRERGWDAVHFDEPINQEDMAFTVIEFDHLAVRGMARLGARVSVEDRRAMHHLWRYAAWLHGVDDELITQSPEEQTFQYEAIRKHQLVPNEDSRSLAAAVLTGIAGQPPFRLSERALRGLTRAMLDEDLRVAYGLHADPVADAAVVALRRWNRAATFAHYHMPGAARLAEQFHYALGRRALERQLGEATKRAFRNIA
ncbi:MAG: oxygenase MpaB family protein [Kofleriaceae bacterium]|nr:oxygenase MpaB family protein [Kofleriaceae bacterium]